MIATTPLRGVRRALIALAVVLPAAVVAEAPAAATPTGEYRATVERLSPQVRTMLVRGGYWRRGCPVGLGDLRLVTVTHRGFDGRDREGEVIVNRRAAGPMVRAFRRLHELRFPIRHMTLDAMYGPPDAVAAPDDVSGAFHCRRAVPSPCSGGTRSRNWSNHAYGLAIDLNPRENPYMGCGRSRNPAVRPYFDRSRVRTGMVTPPVVRAFAAVGWSWGGAWRGDTRDWMHFSWNGR